MSESVIIYTDGACDPNPGTGGWGVHLNYGKHQKQICGGELETTNNRMEMMAAIMGLEALKRPCHVIVYTDSQYLKNGITSWIVKWKRNGWKRGGQPVKNVDLWMRLDAACQRHTIEWRWVKGHAGNHGNELADALAEYGRALTIDQRNGKEITDDRFVRSTSRREIDAGKSLCGTAQDSVRADRSLADLRAPELVA